MPTQRSNTSSRVRAARSNRRGRPRVEDIAALERRLLAVALQQFLAHGYGGTSMTCIVRAAGVSKTTLYSRFGSKEELFRAIVHQQIEHMSPSSLLQTHEGAPDLEEGLRSYANHMLKRSLQGDMLEVNRLIYSESARFPELGAAAGERTELGIRRVCEFLQACAARDGVPCRNPRGVAEVFILMLRGWFVNVMLTNGKVTATQRRKWVNNAVHTLIASRADW